VYAVFEKSCARNELGPPASGGPAPGGVRPGPGGGGPGRIDAKTGERLPGGLGGIATRLGSTGPNPAKGNPGQTQGGGESSDAMLVNSCLWFRR
jgi:hypothetical protein